MSKYDEYLPERMLGMPIDSATLLPRVEGGHQPDPMCAPRPAPPHGGSSGSPLLCPASQAAVELRADQNAILRVRGMLTIDGKEVFEATARAVSLRQSATETPDQFVRRLVLAALDEALEAVR